MAGYVTFKENSGSGREVVLRSAEATCELPPGSAADYAWQVVFGSGGGQRPAPERTVFFAVDGTFPGSTIRRLTLISEAEYDQRRNHSDVARFQPYRQFDRAAQEAAKC